MEEKLAIFGGQPVRKSFLPLHVPFIERKEELAVIKILRSGWLTRGSKCKEFENAFAKYANAQYAIALNSCTAALHLALVSLGIGSGDEIITTPFTFAATVNVIVHTGAVPVFADIDLKDLNINPDKIEKLITAKTRAIMPVHFAGQPCDMDRIMHIARRHNLFVIEDAAHAIESVYNGKKIGSIGHMTAFSFYASKNITTAEGGMLTLNDKKLMKKIRLLSLHGISADAWQRHGPKGYRHWDIIYPGYKYNMNDIQAALGIEQLKKINRLWKRRKGIFKTYNNAFKELPGIALLKRSLRRNSRDALHLYILLIKTEELKADRDEILNAIQAENIGLGVHYRAVHLHPYYQKTFGFRRGDYPNAEYASDRVISLPLFPTMKKTDIRDVINCIKKIINAYRRK